MRPYDSKDYPPVGKIAVIGGGERIHVWPNESASDDCFTGFLLKTGGSLNEWRTRDLSCLWLRSAILWIEEPTDADKRLFFGFYATA